MMWYSYRNIIIIIIIIVIILIITIIIIIIMMMMMVMMMILTHTKTILENTVEIQPQPVALDSKNLSQYSSCSR